MGNKYNILLRDVFDTFNFLVLNEKEFKTVLKAYELGEEKVFLRGRDYPLLDILEIQIYLHQNPHIKDSEVLIASAKIKGWGRKNLGGEFYLRDEDLRKFGRLVTDEFIEGPFGYLSNSSTSRSQIKEDYVDSIRIQEIIDLNDPQFDYTRLLRHLEELNLAYQNQMFLSLTPHIRAIIDQIPPIFGQKSFKGVIGQHGGRSFKASMKILDDSSRKISDAYLHTHIRKIETLPNKTQVNFKNDLDVLLGEIARYRREQLS
ncbi:hypothetical protein [Maribacter aestuarii]|uniref:hypothetical protein n=1 Tax=Maribacter aestuarii TaxID=1130723 RepID=UPI0025A5B4CB|nr:hypothetical protein [Maribacter aestuarii]